MLPNELSLTHAQQQKAVELIMKLISEGVSSGEAIRVIAEKIRRNEIDFTVPKI